LHVVGTGILAAATSVLLAMYVPGYAKSHFLVPCGFVLIWGLLLGIKALALTLWKKDKNAKNG